MHEFSETIVVEFLEVGKMVNKQTRFRGNIFKKNVDVRRQ